MSGQVFDLGRVYPLPAHHKINDISKIKRIWFRHLKVNDSLGLLPIFLHGRSGYRRFTKRLFAGKVTVLFGVIFISILTPF